MKIRSSISSRRPERAEDSAPSPIDLARWLTARPAASADEDPADRDEEERPERAPRPEQTGADLPDYLRGQFDLSLTRVDLRLLERLVGSLDAHGYLTISPEALAREFGVDVGLAARRSTTAHPRPPGIGGYDLADSLCIQLSGGGGRSGGLHDRAGSPRGLRPRPFSEGREGDRMSGFAGQGLL